MKKLFISLLVFGGLTSAGLASGYIGGGYLIGSYDDEDVEGYRVEAGCEADNRVSLEGRYDSAETDSSGDEIKEIRGLLNYNVDLFDDATGFIGAGYANQSIEVLGMDALDVDAILANIGIKLDLGSFFIGATYTHFFCISADSDIALVEEEDTGEVEGHIGYNMTEDLAILATIQTQVYGDPAVEKDWVATFGARWNF